MRKVAGVDSPTFTTAYIVLCSMVSTSKTKTLTSSACEDYSVVTCIALPCSAGGCCGILTISNVQMSGAYHLC